MTPLAPSGPFTALLWETNREKVERIADTPFYRAMSAGTLSRESFRDYLEQDALYLNEDNRALLLTAASCGCSEDKSFFEKLAGEGIALERELHKTLKKEFSLDTERAAGSTRMNTACRLYSSHLIHTAEHRSCRESAAALLPCYWVYQNAGLRVRDRSVDSNPYQSWLETYAGEAFACFSRDFIQLTERMGSSAEPEMRLKMAETFSRSTDLELTFISSFDP